MANRVVLAAVGLVYVSVAVWLGHTEADSYRHSLRARRVPGPVAGAANLTAPAPPKPVETPTTTPTPARQESVPPSEPVAKAGNNPGWLPKLDMPAPPTPGRAPSTPEPPPVRLKPLVVAGLEKAPPAEEMEFGRLLNALIVAGHPLDPEGTHRSKVLDAAQPLIDLRERKDIEITVTVLESDAVNAFSHLGGFIYVTRGLFNLAATDEELRFVVGHELAHLDLKHGQEILSALTRDGTVARVGTLQAVSHQIAAGYTEAQEFEADDRVIDRMLKLDHTPLECLRFLRKFTRLSTEQGFRDGQKAPRSDPASPDQDLDNHFRAQPAAWRRLGRLETRLKATPTRPAGSAPAAPAR